MADRELVRIAAQCAATALSGRATAPTAKHIKETTTHFLTWLQENDDNAIDLAKYMKDRT